MFFNLENQAIKDVEAIRAFELSKPAKDIVFEDEFKLNYSLLEYELLTDQELISLQGTTLICDVESYENYFLICFKSTINGKVVIFEDDDTGKTLSIHKLKWILENFAIVGFNSRDYDVPLCRVALQGFNCRFLKGVSNWIIFDEIRSYQVEQKYKLPDMNINHVDIIEVLPLKGSLKLYAGRLHCKRMQDLPYEHDTILTSEQKDKVCRYCTNDLTNTAILLADLCPQLELRANMSAQYGIDLRSRSDAQIAEYVIAGEIEKITGSRPKRPEILPGKTYYYTPPKCVQFKTKILQDALAVITKSKFVVADNGSIEMPEEIAKLKLSIGKCVHRMGIGGLHSSEKTIAHIADENTLLIDRDVASYYPQIILNNKLAPKHLGKAFLDVYQGLVNRRLAAKKAGSVDAHSLKIVINGSFGKLGSKWSVLYAPDLMIQVTITGQLCLLLLIEALELAGIEVISANTDGVFIKCQRSAKQKLESVIKGWEAATGFVTEEKEYRAVYSRDVNNYIAIPHDGKPKVKGTYSEKGSSGDTVLSRNPESFVCNDAVIRYLTNGESIESTIRSCTDIRRFVTVRNVKGGAQKSGQYLGKCIRWYYSTEMKGQIEYILSKNKVPNSDGAMPLMELPDRLPTDLDFDRYVRIANDILVDIGAIAPIATQKKFSFPLDSVMQA